VRTDASEPRADRVQADLDLHDDEHDGHRPCGRDTIHEPGETVPVNLSNTVGASIRRRRGRGRARRRRSAASPWLGRAISIGTVRVREDDGGTASARFNVSLSRPSAQDVAVDYATVDGMPVAARTTGAATGRLVVPPGATAATVDVPVRGETVR
jgi:hypothetical protein